MVQCISYRIQTKSDSFDLILADLSILGADAFQEHDDALEAFIEGDLLDQQQVDIESYLKEQKLVYQKILHERKDWNAAWESNFIPFTIASKLIVRAPFHSSDPSYPEELVIFPKMAFGTGHHETTSMILEYLLDRDFSGKCILDFGCGTGILGILTAKHQADQVVFIDNDPLCIENTLENLNLNLIKECPVILGSIGEIPNLNFDLIIANITRNILIEALPTLAHHLKQNGALILSGFLQQDFDAMNAQLQAAGLNCKIQIRKGEWLCIIAEKPGLHQKS
ncbi:MAG: 50S ribosomal protein L11 methyltransferase [Saprospiraceae bacterium]|nr:50S ribosomal protein L11 methyltransferase [Saprospiraceae bacterium]HRG69572.1 50S ribosomal protein L11 methyltransferase [Saprospiraceae bacterium]